MTLFPDEMKQADINPATMFISSLSTKEFFSLLSRKVTEYYKINGYDTGIETFEAKIGLGYEQGITVNKVNDYYGYLIAAQYNGKGFFSPTFVSTHITLYSAVRLVSFFSHDQQEAFIDTLITLYLLPLLFITHIKRFPHDLGEKEQFNRFVGLCASTLAFVMEDQHDAIVHDIIYILNNESSVLRNLVSICRRASEVFPLREDTINQHRHWMLDRHLFNHESDDVDVFLRHYDTQSYCSHYESYEEVIMTMLFPNDFSIRSLYDQINIFDTIQHIITPWYQSNDMISTMRDTLSDDEDQRENILYAFVDITYAKENFRKGIQQFIMHHRAQQTIDIDEDVDEFMSSIEDMHDIDMNSVPESIKAESRVVDQIVHFYIGMIGSHRSVKNDNFRYRWTSRIPTLPAGRNALLLTNQTYWNKHFSLYDANGFYYQRAWEHIRQGKQRFHIPLRTSLSFHTNDTYIQKEIITSSLIHLLHDTHHSRMKLTLHQQSILELFRTCYVERIRQWIEEPDAIADVHWGLIDRFVGGSRSALCHTIAKGNYRKPMIDTLYTFDWQLRYDMCDSIIRDTETHTLLCSIYDDSTLIVLMSEIKKTLLGIGLWICYESHHHQSYTAELWLVYFRDVLHIDQLLWEPLQNIFQTHIERQHDLLGLWIHIDDNPGFLETCSGIWHDFLEREDRVVSVEDALWLHSTLHHISSYNMRYIMPD